MNNINNASVFVLQNSHKIKHTIMTPEVIINITDKAFIIILSILLCEYILKIAETFKDKKDDPS